MKATHPLIRRVNKPQETRGNDTSHTVKLLTVLKAVRRSTHGVRRTKVRITAGFLPTAEQPEVGEPL